jgi:hypothetical protein
MLGAPRIGLRRWAGFDHPATKHAVPHSGIARAAHGGPRGARAQRGQSLRGRDRGRCARAGRCASPHHVDRGLGALGRDARRYAGGRARAARSARSARVRVHRSRKSARAASGRRGRRDAARADAAHAAGDELAGNRDRSGHAPRARERPTNARLPRRREPRPRARQQPLLPRQRRARRQARQSVLLPRCQRAHRAPPPSRLRSMPPPSPSEIRARRPSRSRST